MTEQVKDQSREEAKAVAYATWSRNAWDSRPGREAFEAGYEAGLAAANQCVSVDKIAEIVHDALNEYRCLHYLDHDGSGLGLVDRLSPDDDTTITRGAEELAALEDYIMGEIADAYQPKEQGEPS